MESKARSFPVTPWLVAGILLVSGAGLLLFAYFTTVECEFCSGTGGIGIESTDPASGEATRGKMPCRGCTHGRVCRLLIWALKVRERLR